MRLKITPNTIIGTYTLCKVSRTKAEHQMCLAKNDNARLNIWRDFQGMKPLTRIPNWINLDEKKTKRARIALYSIHNPSANDKCIFAFIETKASFVFLLFSLFFLCFRYWNFAISLPNIFWFCLIMFATKLPQTKLSPWKWSRAVALCNFEKKNHIYISLIRFSFYVQ